MALPKVTMTARLPEDLAKKMEGFCKENKLSKNDVIIAAIMYYLEEIK